MFNWYGHGERRYWCCQVFVEALRWCHPSWQFMNFSVVQLVVFKNRSVLLHVWLPESIETKKRVVSFNLCIYLFSVEQSVCREDWWIQCRSSSHRAAAVSVRGCYHQRGFKEMVTVTSQYTCLDQSGSCKISLGQNDEEVMTSNFQKVKCQLHLSIRYLH